MTLRTSSAPADTAARISAASKLSMLTRMPAPDQLADDVAERRERQARRAADVDDVGAGCAERLGRRAHVAPVIFGALLISARISMS